MTSPSERRGPTVSALSFAPSFAVRSFVWSSTVRAGSRLRGLPGALRDLLPRRAPAPAPIPNDPALYERLADRWGDPRGDFAMLYWLAAARAELVPPASRPGAVLVDLGCGGGLLAPHLGGHGYRHLGVDLSPRSLAAARGRGVIPLRGDVTAVPLTDGVADVVVAGEILEHVPDLSRAVAEACRLLRPGGLLVVDTLADTTLARWVAVHIGERVPRMAPRGVHDPALFVNRERLGRECARHGVRLRIRGVRPALRDLPAWLAGRRDTVRMRPVRDTSILYQGIGRKAVAPPSAPTPRSTR